MGTVGAHERRDNGWGDRVGSKLTVDNWMDRILPVGLQRPANVR